MSVARPVLSSTRLVHARGSRKSERFDRVTCSTAERCLIPYHGTERRLQCVFHDGSWPKC